MVVLWERRPRARRRKHGAASASTHAKTAAVFAFFLAVFLCAHVAASQTPVGFCRDTTHPELKGTGYYVQSDTSKAECKDSSWCPLASTTITIPDSSGADIVVYWFSPCCEGGNERPDKQGRPSCLKGRSMEKCSRMDFLTMWKENAIAFGSKTTPYIQEVSPSTWYMNAFIKSGLSHGPSGTSEVSSCECFVGDPACAVAGPAECQKCMVGATPCSEDGHKVYVRVVLDKLVDMDFQHSTLSLKAWLALKWFDERLSFHRQCVGGIDKFDVFAESGNRETSTIWTPDLDLVNQAESVWSGFGARMASVAPCPDLSAMASTANYSKDSCGEVYWVRPGNMQVLCQASGLRKFPFDTLSCEFHFSSATTNGNMQDLAFFDCGFQTMRDRDRMTLYADGQKLQQDQCKLHDETSEVSFQDFQVLSLDHYRTVWMSNGRPFPRLTYKIVFSRAQDYYSGRIILPYIIFTISSFLTFWMNPSTCERIGFGITITLTALTYQASVTFLIPVSQSMVWFDYVWRFSLLFTLVALLETTIVLHIYHHEDEFYTPWWRPVVSSITRRIFRQPATLVPAPHRVPAYGILRHVDLGEEPPDTVKDVDAKEILIRRGLYQKLFNALDRDCSGVIGLRDLAHFLEYMVGHKAEQSEIVEWVRSEMQGDSTLFTLDTFMKFCEGHLVLIENLTFFDMMVDGYLEVAQRRIRSHAMYWRKRACLIDRIARWTVLPSYVFCLTSLCVRMSCDNRGDTTTHWDDFKLMVADFAIGCSPSAMVLAMFGALSVHSWLKQRQAEKPLHDRE